VRARQRARVLQPLGVVMQPSPGVKPPVLLEPDALQSPCPAALALPPLPWNSTPSSWLLGSIPIPLQQAAAVPRAHRQGPVLHAVLGPCQLLGGFPPARGHAQISPFLLRPRAQGSSSQAPWEAPALPAAPRCLPPAPLFWGLSQELHFCSLPPA